jgi:hypothetical protein
MSIDLLEKEGYHIAKKHYSRESRSYPIIRSVLNQAQEGVVLANNPESPSSFFVEHKFGFSQFFGQKDTQFYHRLKNYLFVETAFTAQKIRAYAPNHSDIYHGHAEISERCQFRLGDFSKLKLEPLPEGIVIENATDQNVELINHTFNLDLFNRFWGNKNDFLNHSLAKILMYRGKPTSICYAAAVADGVAEIDVATLPEYWKHHFGKIVCSSFIRECLDRRIIPNWDCFTNNVGSMRLAESLGFVKYGSPYQFFTFSKSKIK